MILLLEIVLYTALLVTALVVAPPRALWARIELLKRGPRVIDLSGPGGRR